MTPFQHGFRKGYSTTTQLVSSIHVFSSILDRSGQVDIIFLDFSKAFDRVPHDKLIIKLENIGLPYFIVRWIAGYLHNRKQIVDIDTIHSEPLDVKSGVPQGSVLGPLLFLIYINDIVSVVHPDSCIRLFADDCVLFREINCQSNQVSLNGSLKAITEWCSLWGMQLNGEKSVLLRLTNKKHPFKFNYNIGSYSLLEVNEYKYLGVTIQNNLKWGSHIKNVCASAFRKLGLIKRKLKISPPELKLLAYYSLIRPKLEYCSIVWDPFTKKDIARLEKVQRMAVRFVYGKYKRTDSPTLLMQSNRIMTLETRRKIARLKFLHKLFYNKINLGNSYFFQLATARPTRYRNSFSLTPIFARTNIFKHSFFPRTVNEWNGLPVEIFSEHFDSDLENYLMTVK